MPTITEVNTVLPTISHVMNAVLVTAAIVGTLYGIGWILYQLDYLDFLDPEDLTSPPANSHAGAPEHHGATR